MLRSYRLLIVIGIFLSAVGLLALLVKDEVTIYFDIHPLSVAAILVFSILLGVLIILYIYLQGGSSKDLPVDPMLSDNMKFEFEKLRQQLIQKIELSYKSPNENETQELIHSRIDKITNDALFEKIEAKYESKFIEDLKLSL